MQTHSEYFAGPLFLLFLLATLAGCASANPNRDPVEAHRGGVVHNTRATYCAAPRKADGRVDVDRLIAELVEVGANTYSFCIHNWATDWDDLQLILPAARAQGIRVWGSIVPPSESPPRLKMYAEPFRLDYVRWAEEFARLSLRETNLVAWSIDDFTHNLKTYTPEYVKAMQAAARAVNPRLAFVPCCYFTAIKPEFAQKYGLLLDGILFPYRHESGGSNLKDASLVESEVRKLKALLGETFPIVLDIYASAHSRLGATTPEYVEQAMIAGHRAAEGVMIYKHQDPKANAAKFQIVKRQFRAWAEEDARRERARILSGAFGTYNAPPRKPDGRVDVQALTDDLTTLKANTYNWLIWHTATDWEDLKLFLPLAATRKIKVWVTLVPPTESPPRTKNYSEPFRLDYERWGLELAKLSVTHPHLIAWSIDDFSHNPAVFSPERLRTILAATREINPLFAFVPCCYYRQLTPQYAEKYRGLIDGILFPYRHESGEMNLQDTDTVILEVARVKELFGEDTPVFIDVYATRHSRLKDSTPGYVEAVMKAGRSCAEGVLIYCHQREAASPEKFGVIKSLFHQWAAGKK